MLTQMVECYYQNRKTLFPYRVQEEIKQATFLMEFFETYGILFNSKNCYIFRSNKGQVSFRQRGDSIYRLCKDNHNMISIIQQRADNQLKDISAGAFNFKQIRQVFEVNWYILMQKCEAEKSILFKILKPDRMGLYVRQYSISRTISIKSEYEKSESSRQQNILQDLEFEEKNQISQNQNKKLENQNQKETNSNETQGFLSLSSVTTSDFNVKK